MDSQRKLPPENPATMFGHTSGWWWRPGFAGAPNGGVGLAAPCGPHPAAAAPPARESAGLNRATTSTDRAVAAPPTPASGSHGHWAVWRLGQNSELDTIN